MAPKRRSLFKRFTIVTLLFMGALLGYLFFNKIDYYFNRDRESSFTMYPGFGIAMPDGFVIHGIDVSRYQKRVNWPVVKQMAEKDIKLGFAFIKATEGNGNIDPYFNRNYPGTLKSSFHNR